MQQADGIAAGVEEQGLAVVNLEAGDRAVGWRVVAVVGERPLKNDFRPAGYGHDIVGGRPVRRCAVEHRFDESVELVIPVGVL